MDITKANDETLAGIPASFKTEMMIYMRVLVPSDQGLHAYMVKAGRKSSIPALERHAPFNCHKWGNFADCLRVRGMLDMGI